MAINNARFKPRKYNVTAVEISTKPPYRFSSSSWTIEYDDAKKIIDLCNSLPAYTKKRGRGNNSNWIKTQAIKFLERYNKNEVKDNG